MKVFIVIHTDSLMNTCNIIQTPLVEKHLQLKRRRRNSENNKFILFHKCKKLTILNVGGESIYGGPFPDEFHSRLRFSRRGLVAMASSGPCTNQSQFFITLDKTEELQRKHTVSSLIILNSQ